MSVEICNLALTALGADTIMALDEDTENARRLNVMYVPVVKDLLRAHPWNFALKRASLAQLAETPPFEFSFYYQLPPGCLRAVEINEDPTINFVVEGRRILCNVGSVDLKYIDYIGDPTLFDPNFTFLLVTRLVAEIAYSITNSRTVSKDRWEIYFALVKTARSSDAQEGKAQRHEAHKWIRGRA